MNITELNISEERKDLLIEKMRTKGYHQPSNPWLHEPDYFIEPDESKYDYRAEIIRWNTRSTRLIRLGIRWSEKKQDWIISYYKQGSTRRIHNRA